MSVSAHVQELRKKHANLSAEVEEAQRNPGMDQLHIATLKKQKLRLKEEISRLSEH
ncbi:MAG: YdcH family protein [Pseudomonadota bacterium]